MVGDIILIAGLPGSGKTTHMDSMRRDGWTVFDDFKANAYDDSPAFQHSRNYQTLLSALRAGQKCAVADIDFCTTSSRAEPEIILRRQIPDVKLSWLFFTNDFHACRENVKRRASRSLEENLRKLEEYSLLYRIPTGARVLPVWSASE
jgi:hypothetical protein